jgi:hypothetical protein
MRVLQGRVVEHCGVPDRVGVLVQLGAIARPSPQRFGVAVD